MAEQWLEQVARCFPFPVAFVLKRDVMEAKTEKERAEGIVDFVEHALRYAALIAANNYAIANFKDERVSYCLERLRRPLTSDLAHFLRESVRKLQEHNELFVIEMSEAVKSAQKQVRAIRLGERGFEEREMPLLDALVNLRNARFHSRFRGFDDKFFQFALPLVQKFLQAMEWMQKYPLFRFVADGQWIKLIG